MKNNHLTAEELRRRKQAERPVYSDAQQAYLPSDLPKVWIQCDNCHQLGWIDLYTGLCIGCGSDEQGILI